jgi:putative acetyltransferase
MIWTFRPAVNRDIPQIKQLVFSVLAEYGLKPDPEGTDVDLDDVEQNYAGRGGRFEVVTTADGELVGSVGLYPLDGSRAELRKMYLKPSARGQGLGRRLLERTLQQARALGFREIWLETNSVLKEAIQLYEKYGFAPARAEHIAPRCDQVMMLKLTDGCPSSQP